MSRRRFCGMAAPAALRELAQSSHVFCADVISMVQASAVHIDSEHLDHAYSSFLIMSIILLKAAEEDGQSAETVKKKPHARF